MAELPLVLLLLLVTALLLRMDVIFYIVYVLAGTYALARWWAGHTVKQLRVSRSFQEHIFAGEGTDVEIEIENKSWWPVPWLRYLETPPAPLSTGGPLHQAIALRPRERVRLSYGLVGQRRGYYRIGPGVLRTGDLFGFTEMESTFDAPAHLTVYPRVIPLSNVDLTSRSPHGTVKSRQQIFADPARVAGVRPYRQGDPLRSIDWKSSARVGELHVKKVEPAVSLTSVICVDLNASAYTRQWRIAASEWGIVVAASLISYLAGERQAVGLASNGVDALTGLRCWSIAPRGGRTHLMKLLEWLARAQAADSAALADWLPSATSRLTWGTTVIAVTPSGDAALCAALHRLRRAGLNPVLVVIEPHARFGVVQERARRLGVAAYDASSEACLAQWRGGTAGTRS